MANVWDTLVGLDCNLSVKLNPSAIGEAIVVANTRKHFRVGRGNLNLQTSRIDVVDAKWHHIMYLNQLKDTRFINSIADGTVSVDVTAGNMCAGSSIIEDHLDKIDYFFISDEDLYMDIDELGRAVKGWAILHYPQGSYATNGKEHIEHKTQVIGGIDVLGAGDIFAACFMSRSLTEGEPIDKVIDYAHLNTKQILINKSEDY